MNFASDNVVGASAKVMAALGEANQGAAAPYGADAWTRRAEEALSALVQNADAVTEGQNVFKTTCASCHGQNAEGLVGPNLTDKFWIHGASGKDVLKSIADGYADKGMPAWGAVIGDDKARKVTAYVLSLKGKNLPGKEPQGQPID